MKYSTNQFKQGLKISIDGEPCSIISHEFHKPGKGQAVMRTKLYNLRTQKVWERTFKSGVSTGSPLVDSTLRPQLNVSSPSASDLGKEAE